MFGLVTKHHYAVIRQHSLGVFYVLRDQDHIPRGFTTNDSIYIHNDYLVVPKERTKHGMACTIAPDESLSLRGAIMGASVGLDKIWIRGVIDGVKIDWNSIELQSNDNFFISCVVTEPIF